MDEANTDDFIREVRRVTREARDRSIIDEASARREKLFRVQALREEAERDANNEWPDLKIAIRQVAAKGEAEIVWGIPAYDSLEKNNYYFSHMKHILIDHGFNVQATVTGDLKVQWS